MHSTGQEANSMKRRASRSQSRSFQSKLDGTKIDYAASQTKHVAHSENDSPPASSLSSDDRGDNAEKSPNQSSASEDSLVRFSLLGKHFAVPGRYLLYTVPFLWGTFGPAVRILFSSDPHPVPSLFNTERLLLSNMVYLPILINEFYNVREKLSRAKENGNGSGKGAARTNEEDPLLSVKAGLELGTWVFCANVAQVIGLQSTSASRAAFLVQLQTVIIPLMSALLGLNKVNRNTWIGSVIAVTGVAFLSFDKSHGTAASVVGDCLEVLSALFFSAYVVRLGSYCSRIKPGPLVAAKLVVQAGLSVIWAASVEAIALAGPHPGNTLNEGTHAWTVAAAAVNIAVVAWTGLMSSALSGWLQTKGQQSVPASETAVIFATQPLWASATASVILGEAFGVKGITGGALIVLATVFSSLKGPDSDKNDKSVKQTE